LWRQWASFSHALLQFGDAKAFLFGAQVGGAGQVAVETIGHGRHCAGLLGDELEVMADITPEITGLDREEPHRVFGQPQDDRAVEAALPQLAGGIQRTQHMPGRGRRAARQFVRGSDRTLQANDGECGGRHAQRLRCYVAVHIDHTRGDRDHGSRGTRHPQLLQQIIPERRAVAHGN
jgi:hypothetical protein